MACRGCGQKKNRKRDPNSQKCCLCGRYTSFAKPWGKQFVCKRCRDSQKEKLENMKKDVARIKAKLAGKE